MDSLISFVAEINFWGIFFVGLAVTYVTGRFLENRHFASLTKREHAGIALPLVTREKLLQSDHMVEGRLVCGNVVIAADFFKINFSALLMFFGGSISPYETVIDRARREAILRMRDEAKGAKEIIAVRLTTSQLGMGRIEIMAYGTAIYAQA